MALLKTVTTVKLLCFNYINYLHDLDQASDKIICDVNDIILANHFSLCLFFKSYLV